VFLFLPPAFSYRSPHRPFCSLRHPYVSCSLILGIFTSDCNIGTQSMNAFRYRILLSVSLSLLIVNRSRTSRYISSASSLRSSFNPSSISSRSARGGIFITVGVKMNCLHVGRIHKLMLDGPWGFFSPATLGCTFFVPFMTICDGLRFFLQTISNFCVVIDRYSDAVCEDHGGTTSPWYVNK